MSALPPKTAAIILAAGMGKRIGATELKNKVMFEIGDKPMIEYPVALFQSLGIKPIVVVGYANTSVQDYLGDRVTYVIQEDLSGTAKAVEFGMKKVAPDIDHVLVFMGDHSTFYTQEIVHEAFSYHKQTDNDVTIISTESLNPTGYGRILRDENKNVEGIVEEKVATDEQKKITEINTGNYIFRVRCIQELLPLVQRNPVSQEFYLTDIVELARARQMKVGAYFMQLPGIELGVNTQEQLEEANDYLQQQQHHV